MSKDYQPGSAGSDIKPSEEQLLTPGTAGVTVLEQYRYPFENLVFEGGSNKLLAYCGAVRILEETEVWKQIVRLCGSGTGAVAAVLLSVGFTSAQLETFFSDDLRSVIKDRTCGQCCLGCSCFSFGYHPGKSIIKWLGMKLKEASGKANITFAEVHGKFKKELCIVVTNASESRLEYFHVKTTPAMPVIEAVQMTLAYTGLCEPVKRKNSTLGTDEVFVEGGILCNYPIHCYDGWWLSLKPDDSFLNKLPTLDNLAQTLDRNNRFANINNKTIGLVTFDESSTDQFSTILSSKFKDVDKTKHPETNLSKSRSKVQENKAKLATEYAQFVALSNKILKLAEEQKQSLTEPLSKDDVQAVLMKCHLSDDEFRNVFGSKVNNVDEVFRLVVPRISKNEVTAQDLHRYFENKRAKVQLQSSRDHSRPIKNVLNYFEAVEDAVYAINLRTSIDMRPKDAERTVAIDVGYIRQSDSGLQTQDKHYLIEQGKNAMRFYLGQYVKRVPQLKDDGERRSFCRDDFKQFIDDDVSEIIDEKDYMETYLEKVL